MHTDNRINRRMVTVHAPDAHKPPRERCSGFVPQCSMNHYYEVPAITRRGTWNFLDLLHGDSAANLAMTYIAVGGKLN